MKTSARPLRAAITGLVPPLLAGGLLLVVYACFGLYPFGGQSVAWCDMNQQVIPLLAQFRSILLGDGNMFLSGAAGGINFWGVFFFFLSSPFSFLSVFSSLEGLPWFMNWMVLWKMMVCAGTAALFFRRMSGDGEKAVPALLGVAYAFSGYAMLYFQNVVWLDMMALFPLLALSLIALEKKRRVLPFIAAFAAMLAVNYYLSYMVVLFLLLGFGLYQFFCSSRERRGESILLLGCGAVLALLLTAVVWLPSLLEVLTSARGEGLLDSLSAGSLAAETDTTLPLLFTTALPFGALCFLRRREARTGVFTAVSWMCLLFLIAMLVRPINKMWHTGSYQGFPVRYGYMLTLLLLFLGWRIIRSIRPPELPRRSALLPAAVVLVAAGAYLGLVLSLLAGYFEQLGTYTRTLWWDWDAALLLLLAFAAAAAAFCVLLWAYRSGFLTRRFFLAALALLIGAESFWNGGVYMGTVDRSQNSYLAAVQLAGQVPEDGFFRLKTQGKYFDVNLFSAAGYDSLSHYTSLTPETTLVSQRRLGYSGYWMEVNSNGGTAFSDALLANRYEVVPVSELGPDELSSADTVYVGDSLAIVRLPYSMPDAIITSAEPGFLEELPAASRAEIQQALADALFPGNENLFTIFQPDETEGLTISDGGYYLDSTKPGVLRWVLRPETDMILYFDCAAAPSNALSEAVNKSCTIYVNGQLLRQEYPSQSENGILELGNFSAGETVEIVAEVSKDIQPESLEVFGLNTGMLEELCTSAKSAEIEETGSRYTVRCTASEGESLFLPISWDEGWTAAVNGKEVSLSRAAGNYLSLPLEEGDNLVELRYTPPGFQLGAGISAVGLLAVVLFLLYGKKRLTAWNGLKKTAVVLFTGASIGVALMVYFFPLVIYILKG